MLVLASLGCVRPGAGQLTTQPIPTGFPRECRPGQVQVMLLGTLHFANPGRDAVAQEVDDVLAPRRQRELRDLTERLAGWAPEQIAVEWPFDFRDSTAERYRRYRAGTLAPDRNEVVQVGFRLAAARGLPGVEPIDHPMSFWSDSVEALAERRPDLVRVRDSLLARAQEEADARREWTARASFVELLADANSEAALRGGNSLTMFGSLIGAGDGANYAGPESLARWYARNFKMAYHLAQALRPATRRVLVIVGSAHVPPLRNILDEAPQFCPVSPLPLLTGSR